MERANRPRPTKVKLLLCGRIAIATYYEKEIWYNSLYSKEEKFPRDKSDMTEEDKQDIRRRSISRTKKTIFNLISTNAWFWKRDAHSVFWPSFLTLTFKDNITNIKDGNYLHNKFIKKLNYYVYRTKTTQLKYLSVLEFQKRGAIHYHILFFNLPMVDKKILAEIWDHGFILIKGIDKEKNIAGYLTKYITKDSTDTRLDGKKRYSCSRNLLKPFEINVEAEALSVISKIPDTYVKHRAEFNSAYHGKVMFVEYDFGQGKSFTDAIKAIC